MIGIVLWLLIVLCVEIVYGSLPAGLIVATILTSPLWDHGTRRFLCKFLPRVGRK